SRAASPAPQPRGRAAGECPRRPVRPALARPPRTTGPHSRWRPRWPTRNGRRIRAQRLPSCRAGSAAQGPPPPPGERDLLDRLPIERAVVTLGIADGDGRPDPGFVRDPEVLADG